MKSPLVPSAMLRKAFNFFDKKQIGRGGHNG